MQGYKKNVQWKGLLVYDFFWTWVCIEYILIYTEIIVSWKKYFGNLATVTA